MTTHRNDLQQRLGTGKLIGIDHGEGSRVNCIEGALWITQSNDPRDVVIAQGESFVLDRPGLALVCAAAGPRGGRRGCAASSTAGPPTLPVGYAPYRPYGSRLVSPSAELNAGGDVVWSGADATRPGDERLVVPKLDRDITISRLPVEEQRRS